MLRQHSPYRNRAEWHHFVSINPDGSNESHLIYLFWYHLDLIVTRRFVHEGEDLVTDCCINHHLRNGQWKSILGTSRIQFLKVDADLNLAILLFYYHYVS